MIESEENNVTLRDVKTEIGDRLRKIRLSHQLTLEEFANQFSSFIGQSDAFKRQTVARWEKGSSPKDKSIYAKIAEFYQVPIYYLIPNDNTMDPIKSNEFVMEISDKLQHYNGEPVWCCMESDAVFFQGYGRWGIIDIANHAIVFDRDNYVYFANINFPIYKRPLPFTFSPDAIHRPLSIKEIKNRTRVWLEPIGGDYYYRQQLKGWGKYNSDNDSIITAGGCTYQTEFYGKTFLCFSEPCLYKEEEIYTPD